MTDINYLLVSDALVVAGRAVALALRYRSVRRRQQVIEAALARAGVGDTVRLVQRVNRVLLVRRHLEELLRTAAASLHVARFSAIVPAASLRDTVLTPSAPRARSAVVGFNGTSLVIDGIAVPALRGSGSGLAVVSRRHVQKACTLSGRRFLIDVQLGFWGVLSDSGATLLRFPLFGLSRREVRS